MAITQQIITNDKYSDSVDLISVSGYMTSHHQGARAHTFTEIQGVQCPGGAWQHGKKDLA